MRILYLIELFPGFEGYTGGGAEINLERLISGIKRFYPDEFQPILYVASQRNIQNNKAYPFDIIEDPKKDFLLEIVKKYNTSDASLHIGSTFLMIRHLDIFRQIVEIWKGSIIQRVTLTSKIEELKEKLQDQFLSYISLIDIFISQSDQMSGELERLGVGKHQIVQIENGIDFESKKPLSREEKKILLQELIPEATELSTIFLFVGRFHDPVKKVDDLLRAWIRGRFSERNCYLILAGDYGNKDTSLQKNLVSFFNNCSSEEIIQNHILFTGLLSEAELMRYYQSADVYVTPSECEGFSNAMLEAMAFCLPVIARVGVSGNEHLVVPDGTGLLFDSVGELEERMRYLELYPSVRQKLGKNGRNLVKQNFSIEIMVKKYVKLYRRLSNKEQE